MVRPAPFCIFVENLDSFRSIRTAPNNSHSCTVYLSKSKTSFDFSFQTVVPNFWLKLFYRVMKIMRRVLFVTDKLWGFWNLNTWVVVCLTCCCRLCVSEKKNGTKSHLCFRKGWENIWFISLQMLQNPKQAWLFNIPSFSLQTSLSPNTLQFWFLAYVTTKVFIFSSASLIVASIIF